MNKFSFSEGTFGKHPTVILTNKQTGSKLEIALTGAIALKYLVPVNGKLLDILDGFETPEELVGTKGARNWIMVPFANRIQNGTFKFNGIEYHLDPIPPRNQVMHGLLSNVLYEVFSSDKTENSISVTLVCRKIRKDIIKGYPFSFDVYVKYKMEDDKLTVTVTGENIGEKPAPFFSGWHGYFKTGDDGIEHLELTVDADNVILVNDDLIPEQGFKAFGNISDYPALDFRSKNSSDSRTLKDKKLDNGFSQLKKYPDGYSRSNLHDPKNGFTLSVFQRGGVTLVFTGDSLPSRRRKAVAIEPMQFMTDSFNRIEESEGIVVMPGKISVFEFGVEIIK